MQHLQSSCQPSAPYKETQREIRLHQGGLKQQACKRKALTVENCTKPPSEGRRGWLNKVLQVPVPLPLPPLRNDPVLQYL